ncbi:MAG: ATP-dependent 6-phosphofructokinase [Kiritimatiellia bacterium]|jgi:6-phosphofructokinase 1
MNFQPSLFDRVLSNPEAYEFDVASLGPCKIDSPARERWFVPEGARCALSPDVEIRDGAAVLPAGMPSFEKAGAHRKIFHDPAWSRAAILTAGGLCPGLNHVIKALVEILNSDYGVKTIYGIRYGFRGFIAKHGYEPLMLDPDNVDTIHELGGTILGSSRGQQDVGEIVDAIIRMNINLLFCVGGDGTLRGAHDIAMECKRRRLFVSVVAVPKTVDNDLNFVGNSFGFETAVAETSPIIQAAHIEARGTVNGVGLVKLMGRDSGFIAAYATVANPVVNFCLIPEMPFALDGPNGLLAALERRFRKKDHCVIVVAEGAGQDLITDAVPQYDPSGNLLKKDIGEFLKKKISAHFEALGVETSVKYFDPSYSIRSVPARGSDAIHCHLLACNAVHAAMAGRTDCVVGNMHHGSTYTLVPIVLATMERQKVDLASGLWGAVLDATCQGAYFGTSE